MRPIAWERSITKKPRYAGEIGDGKIFVSNIDQIMRVEDLNVCIEQPRTPKAQPTKPKSRPKKRFKQLQS